MRLWHEALITKLPRQQLLGQHREIAALRGNGWGKKHATVDYVFLYSPYKLYQFHILVMGEMKKRGYQPDIAWYDKDYRGKSCVPYKNLSKEEKTKPIYPEHDERYLQECIDNLVEKGIFIS
ncbi:MAG: TIGR02328 family protein [Liquorilactobacillus sp.]|uniref:TIGR02328 family protein n=1 Tax=Liquorilactobacillus sp. TaxID=2767923 RepID=UPI0039E7CDA8